MMDFLKEDSPVVALLVVMSFLEEVLSGAVDLQVAGNFNPEM